MAELSIVFVSVTVTGFETSAETNDQYRLTVSVFYGISSRIHTTQR